MSFEFTFTCPLPHGFHARPASHLAAVANNFIAECTLTNLRSGIAADLKSVLSIIAADIRLDDPCSVRVHGQDEAAASAGLQQFIHSDLAVHDLALPELLPTEKRRELPRALRLAGVQAWFGRPASRGMGKGKAVVVGGIQLQPEPPESSRHDPVLEEQQINRAIAAVRTRIQGKLLEQLSVAESGILQAHLAILGDAALTARMMEQVARGISAAQAIVETNTFFGDKLRRSENPLLRERALDIHGICLELLENVSGVKPTAAVELRGPSVVVAENLTPQQLSALDRKWIRGLVMESAGTTSHTVILARALEIPTLVAVKNAQTLASGTEIIVDANRGFLIFDSTLPVTSFYERESKTMERRKRALARYGEGPAHTRDGRTIGVSVNVASTQEVNEAFNAGATSIGVFRTEMLFLRREQPPSEEEQFEIYAHAARAAQGKPVVIRTFDVGGDKPLRFLKMPAEDNPFLGYRGVRVYAQNQELLRTQLRAIIRASAVGRIHLMVPMVSTIEEVFWFKGQVAQVQSELEGKRIAFDGSMPVGTMIEVPSSAFILDQLGQKLDFFSIGTNDLSQYFFAADRGNPRVTSLANVRHPAFLRLLQQIMAGAGKYGKSVSVCGDMAADLRSVPLLIALGVEEISVPVPDIPMVKERISKLSLSECRQLLSEVLERPGAEDVERLLDREPAGAAQSLLTLELILVGNDIASKEEAIREIIDALYVEGRTDDPDRLEDAVWARESVYSTGLGHGFAVPHCKSDAVSTASIAVMKLKKPVDWEAVDGNPVEIVIFLAARESDAENEHLRVFSWLARNLMDEEFRDRLLRADKQEDLLSVLKWVEQDAIGSSGRRVIGSSEEKTNASMG
ncbi:MAG TPA: phosphoenolpyruvate--protein phosphotransferase [Candidatus Angelobacter sp.]